MSDLDDTNGRSDARQAVEAAQQSSRRTDTVIAGARQSLEAIRASHQNDHFADKFREIIRGGN